LKNYGGVLNICQYKIYADNICPLSALKPRGHPDTRVKHCAYGHSVTTKLNPRGVTTVSHKDSLTFARHATVVVALPSTAHYPTNYKVKIYYLK
jgi:hypothetical protein